MKHQTKQAILDAGVKSWPHVSARAIARELGTTHSAVLYHFGSIRALSDEVAAEAVRIGDRRVVLMLIAERHSAVAGLSDAERRRFVSMA